MSVADEIYPTAHELKMAELDEVIAAAVDRAMRPPPSGPRGLVFYGKESERCDAVAGECVA